MEDTASNRLSIYLIKEGITRYQDMVQPEARPVPIDGVGTFFYSSSEPKPPQWITKFFGSRLDSELPLLSAHAQGLLIVPIKHEGKPVYFAATFGYGRFLLKDDVVEGRFGLKVVLNSADPESLRSIDKTTLGSVPKHSREQMSREVNAREFGIDIEQDLVSSVTAKSLDPKFGKMPSGKDSLNVSAKVDITNIVNFLQHCYSRYRSEDYKVAFGWIDQIAEIKSTSLEKALNEKLAQKLQKKDVTKTWMAVPHIVNWEDVAGFTYLRPRASALYSDIGIETFLDSLNGLSVTHETLKDELVFMVRATDGATERWTAYQCTYSEIEHEGKFFILTGGKWYEIAKDFTEQVIDNYRSFPNSPIKFPDFNHQNEAEYNAETASTLEICCMDRDPILHGGGQSSVEFCDLITPQKQLVHVKRYGASSVLSHLFNQGVVSAELFAADAAFRKKVNDKLPKEYQLPNPLDTPNIREYEIVYAIVSYSSDPLDIPFFSKVALKNARRRLMGYGYKVALNKIQSNTPKRVTRLKNPVTPYQAIT